MQLSVQDSIEHLFRHEYGKIVSALTNKYSSQKIDLIEDAVCGSLEKAMQVWGYQYIPDNPSAWIYRVANNSIIDQLRRNSKSVDYEFPEDFATQEIDVDETAITSGLKDGQLKMIFACCHPQLTTVEQIMLSLKLIGGLSVSEIANALMKKNDAVKKAITRAKQKFKEIIGYPDIPNYNELDQRLHAVLKIIYLIFNEGYKATEGKNLIKKDVCFEAIRLAELLTENEKCNVSELNALLALMYFNTARFDARIGSEGEMITLEFQDRSKWDERLIVTALNYIHESSKDEKVTTYHLEAAITFTHMTANSYPETDWKMILSLYDALINLNDSPFTALNRIVAIIKVKGYKEAKSELEKIEEKYNLTDNYLFHSIKGNIEFLSGNKELARICFEKAMKLSKNKIEKEFLEKKLSFLN